MLAHLKPNYNNNSVTEISWIKPGNFKDLCRSLKEARVGNFDSSNTFLQQLILHAFLSITRKMQSGTEQAGQESVCVFPKTLPLALKAKLLNVLCQVIEGR